MPVRHRSTKCSPPVFGFARTAECGHYCHAVTEKDHRREAQFPAIEKRTGKPMAHWFEVMAGLAGQKYEQQMAALQNEHGFTRAHANALVMFTKGSTTSRRVDTVEEYMAALPAGQAATARRIFDVIAGAYPDLEQVIAWNQPMVRLGKRYLFGMGAASKHMLISPWDVEVLDQLAPRLVGLKRNKKTVQVPNDWDVDEQLLIDMVGMQLARIEE